MPTSRKTKHGSGKPHRPKPLTYDPVYTDGLTDDLRAALKSKLTLKVKIPFSNDIDNLLFGFLAVFFRQAVLGRSFSCLGFVFLLQILRQFLGMTVWIQCVDS